MKKRTTTLLQLIIGIIILGNASVFAKTPPPINDECSGAIFITPTTTNSYTTYDNLNSTVSAGVIAPTGATPMSADVWFAVMVSTSGHLIFDAIAGSMSDGGMAIYTGSCGSLNLIACNDNKSTGYPPNDNMPQIDKIGLPMYMIVYIRFWGKGGANFGTFGLTVISAPTQPACTNLCFENDLTGWFATLGQQYNGAVGAASPVYFPILFNNTAGANFNIETTGTDPYGNFPKVYSGAKSIRIGDEQLGQT